MPLVKTILNSLGFETMFAVGAGVFVVGTALFIAELSGYEIRVLPPGIHRTGLRWDAMAVVQVSITAAIFGAGLVATAGIVFLPGIAYLRPAQAFVAVFGILFGVPGALGCALGNLIADLFGGYLTLGSVASRADSVKERSTIIRANFTWISATINTSSAPMDFR